MVTLLAIGVAPARAQLSGQMHVKGGAGFLSFPDYLGLVLVGLGSIDTTEGVTRGEFIPLVGPSAELERVVSERFSWGGFFALGCASAWTKFDSNGALNKRTSAIYPSLGIGCTTRYFRVGNFSMYGSWGLGVTFYAVDQYTASGGSTGVQMAVFPTANLYPLSFKIGSQSGFYTEIGWGSKGFVSMGGFKYF